MQGAAAKKQAAHGVAGGGPEPQKRALSPQGGGVRGHGADSRASHSVASQLLLARIIVSLCEAFYFRWACSWRMRGAGAAVGDPKPTVLRQCHAPCCHAARCPRSKCPNLPLKPLDLPCSMHVGLNNGRRAAGCPGAERHAGLPMSPRLRHPPFSDFPCTASAWRRAWHVLPAMLQPQTLLATGDIVSWDFFSLCVNVLGPG